MLLPQFEIHLGGRIPTLRLNSIFSNIYSSLSLYLHCNCCNFSIYLPISDIPKIFDNQTRCLQHSLAVRIIITMMLTEYKYVGFWQILFTPAFIISIPVYFRFLSEEMLEGDDTARRMSLAAGIILIAFFGQQMTWWLAQLISINDEFIARFAIEAGVGSHSYIPNWIGYTVTNSLGTIAILSLGVGETWRASSKGINGFTIVIYLILGVGLISGIADFAVLDIVDSCMYTVCENFPENYNIWYKFTTEALLLLFTPLMVMYILLHFDVIDSEAEQNRWMTKQS